MMNYTTKNIPRRLYLWSEVHVGPLKRFQIQIVDQVQHPELVQVPTQIPSVEQNLSELLNWSRICKQEVNFMPTQKRRRINFTSLIFHHAFLFQVRCLWYVKWRTAELRVCVISWSLSSLRSDWHYKILAVGMSNRRKFICWKNRWQTHIYLQYSSCCCCCLCVVFFSKSTS